MPLANQQIDLSILTAAVDGVLEKVGIVAGKDRASSALIAAGLDIEDCATHLANLVLTGKEATKLKGLDRAFQLHGISLRDEEKSPGAPVINIAIQANTANLNQLFAPERGT